MHRWGLSQRSAQATVLLGGGDRRDWQSVCPVSRRSSWDRWASWTRAYIHRHQKVLCSSTRPSAGMQRAENRTQSLELLPAGLGWQRAARKGRSQTMIVEKGQNSVRTCLDQKVGGNVNTRVQMQPDASSHTHE